LNNINKTSGLTLFEVMATLGIMAVLAAIAWPLYDKTQERSRRVEAKAALLTSQAFMEKCFSTYRDYNNVNCQALPSATSADNNYDIAITAATADTYNLQATPAAGGKQVNDTDCAEFNVTETGAKTAFKSDATPNNQACWGHN